MPNTKEIDLFMAADGGFGLYAGSATIEVDPIDRRITGLTVIVEKGSGRHAVGREINCFAGSDSLAFDDKPIAAHVEALAVQWLAGADGQEWLDSLKATRAELRHAARAMAEAVSGEAA